MPQSLVALTALLLPAGRIQPEGGAGKERKKEKKKRRAFLHGISRGPDPQGWLLQAWKHWIGRSEVRIGPSGLA